MLVITEKFDGLISPNKHFIDQPHCNRNVTSRLFNNVAEKTVMVVNLCHVLEKKFMEIEGCLEKIIWDATRFPLIFFTTINMPCFPSSTIGEDSNIEIDSRHISIALNRA